MILADRIVELRKKERLVSGRTGGSGRRNASVGFQVGKRPVGA